MSVNTCEYCFQDEWLSWTEIKTENLWSPCVFFSLFLKQSPSKIKCWMTWFWTLLQTKFLFFFFFFRWTNFLQIALRWHHCPRIQSLSKVNRKPVPLTLVATWQHWRSLISLRNRVKYLASYAWHLVLNLYIKLTTCICILREKSYQEKY